MPALTYSIVLGSPRSGTTFLMRVLDAMPRTEAVSGILWPVALPHLLNQELPDDVRRVIEDSFASAALVYLRSGVFNSRSAALRKWAVDRDGGVRGLVAAGKGQRSIERFVYKEPFFAFAPTFARTALPAARLVYIVRDGRDVADSLVRTYDVLSDEALRHENANEIVLGRRHGDRFVPWWVEHGRDDEFLAASQYTRAVWMWRTIVERCREQLSGDDERVLTVGYEELVTEPVATLERVARHLGAELTPRMRDRASFAHTRSVGVHRRRSASEIADAERIAGDELRAHGYL